MFLENEDLKRLRAVALQTLDYAVLKQLVGDIGHNIETYSMEKKLDLVLVDVLRYANAEGWIEHLIQKMRDRYPAVPELANFHRATPPLAAPPPAAGPPLSACDEFSVIYVDNRPFLDRTKLRATLKALAAPEGPRILHIRGETRSGKTYTQYLIKHLGKKIGFEFIPLDLTRFDELTPFEIGSSINLRMTLAEPPTPGQEQWSRWIRRYFDNLVGQIRKNCEVSNKSWWIVFDNFKAVSVPEDINDFVDALSIRINEELHNIRAVLISYERDLPPDVTPIVAEDRTTSIGVTELSEFFVQFYSDHKPHISAEDRTRKAVAKVTEVLVKTANGGQGHDLIGAEVLTQCRNILAENP